MLNATKIMAIKVMMPKSSPVRCTILVLVAIAYKREQHKNTLQKAPVWSWPNTPPKIKSEMFLQL